MEINVNIFAVLLSGVASMAVGFLWYGPLFGKVWTKLMGIKKEDMKAGKTQMMKTYGISFVASLVMAYILSNLLVYVGAISLLDGMRTGFWMWLGFVATVQVTDFLYGGKPFMLFLLNTGYQLASLIVMGAILVSWV